MDCKIVCEMRPLLYSDTLDGQQVLRDDLWAVSTKELNRIHGKVERAEARIAKLREALHRIRCNDFEVDENLSSAEVMATFASSTLKADDEARGENR